MWVYEKSLCGTALLVGAAALHFSGCDCVSGLSFCVVVFALVSSCGGEVSSMPQVLVGRDRALGFLLRLAFSQGVHSGHHSSLV